jgi:hypothetical protein
VAALDGGGGGGDGGWWWWMVVVVVVVAVRGMWESSATRSAQLSHMGIIVL